jgi:hypothetical protein
MSDKAAYTRWTADEYLRVAVNALQFMVPGKPTVAAFAKGQKLALSRPRHRPASEIERIGKSGTLAKYEAPARALSAEKRAEYLVPVPEVVPKPARTTTHAPDPARKERKALVYWTTREKALIARYVKTHRDESRTLTAWVIEAMQTVLPPDRWQNKQGVYDKGYRKLLEPMLAEGERNEWLLKDDEETNPGVLSAGDDLKPLEADAGATLQRAAEAPAPQAAPEPSGSLERASRAFADTMAQALQVLLAASAEHTLSNLSNRVAAIAQDVGTSIAAQIERGLRQTVLDTMAAELGGPVAPPTTQKPLDLAPAPAAPVHATEPDQRRKLLKVDVVGLIGNNVQLVRAAFNGNTDIRFIDPDHLNQWAPHTDRHAIAATKWIPHKAKAKCRAAGVQPINVTGSVGTVIHAIEELHRNAGIPV